MTDNEKLDAVEKERRLFGQRAAARLWLKLGLDWVPAMADALLPAALLDHPPGSVTITVTPTTPH